MQFVTRLIDTVHTWPHVTVAQHRFGGTEFRLEEREFGHVHQGGMLDIPYYRPLRDLLVDRGETDVHHLLRESGWTTDYVVDETSLEHGLWLLKLSYAYHVTAVRRKRPEAFPDVSLDDLFAELALDDELRAVVERRATP